MQKAAMSISASRRIFIIGQTILALLPPAVCAQAAPARTADPAVGEYSSATRELIAGLRLDPDGGFEYGLTVGSLDERARGRWKREGERIVLVSEPRPTPPSIAPDRIENAPGQPFSIRLLGPGGQDIPMIDLRIDFETGPPLESYLAGGPWTWPASEERRPRFVTFSKKAYGIDSGRLPLRAEDGKIATFRLTPNDLGVVDLTGAYLEPNGDELILVRRDGSLSFSRISDASPAPSSSSPPLR